MFPFHWRHLMLYWKENIEFELDYKIWSWWGIKYTNKQSWALPSSGSADLSWSWLARKEIRFIYKSIKLQHLCKSCIDGDNLSHKTHLCTFEKQAKIIFVTDKIRAIWNRMFCYIFRWYFYKNVQKSAYCPVPIRYRPSPTPSTTLTRPPQWWSLQEHSSLRLTFPPTITDFKS